MKNLFKGALLMLFITIAPALQSKDLENAPMGTLSESPNAVEAQRMTQRLEEIKAMDKSTMTRSEKKALRKEVKAIQKVSSDGGVYLSVGAVIIIILLLILLL